MVDWVAALLRERVENGREVERLPRCVPHKLRHVFGRHELLQRGRQQPVIIDVLGRNILAISRVNYLWAPPSSSYSNTLLNGGIYGLGRAVRRDRSRVNPSIMAIKTRPLC